MVNYDDLLLHGTFMQLICLCG